MEECDGRTLKSLRIWFWKL